MENQSSPIETLRQLQAMLDAGTITPTEFATLKQRLVFGAVEPEPTSDPLTPPDDSARSTPELVADSDTLAVASPELLVPAPAEPLPATGELPDDRYDAPLSAAPRNYLNLVLSIGGLLALLALVLYLSFNDTRSEGVTSLTRDTEDSTAYETGPQAALLPQRDTVPDTLRLNPVAPMAPARAELKVDSATVPAPVLPADTVQP